VYRSLVGKLERKNHREKPVVDGKVIFRWIFSKWDVGAWTGLSWIRIRACGGHL
jgi:hypothetical protein